MRKELGGLGEQMLSLGLVEAVLACGTDQQAPVCEPARSSPIRERLKTASRCGTWIARAHLASTVNSSRSGDDTTKLSAGSSGSGGPPDLCQGAPPR